MYSRHEMLELVVVDGQARGIVARNLATDLVVVGLQQRLPAFVADLGRRLR